NQLAHHLIALGVGPEVLVGICMERSFELIVGLLGILKAGAAYVPLDPGYPRERLAFMLADTRSPVLLTQQRLLAQLPRYEGRLLCLDRDWPQIVAAGRDRDSQKLGGGAARPWAAGVASSDPAYVIYTSGSSGEPKGVLGLHQGMVNRLSWMWQKLPFGADEILCQKTSLSFGDSICEIFGPLSRGFPLVVVSDESANDPRRLVELLARRQVTRIVLVPALLAALLELFDDLADRLPKLSLWMSSGEALSPELLQRFRTQLPGCRLINLYGASEVSADVTFFDVTGAAAGSPVLIGRPISNTQIYLLNQGEPVPLGVAGEIFVGGAGLARGYLNRPELTLEKFLPDPFTRVPGARIYRTGDLARYLPNGQIEYLGRIDGQVKIRGFRIELGEIEGALRQHPAVQNAAVQDRETDAGGKELVAFIVNKPNVTLSGPDLREFLLRKLPRHLMPDRMFWGGALPLNVNGKLDRVVLKNLSLPTGGEESSRQPPYDALQATLLKVWMGLLETAEIGINDNFFDLGGNSLKAVIMLSRVEKLTGWLVPLTAIYDCPTVKSLARFMLENEGRRQPSALIEIQAGTEGPPFFFMHGDMHGGGYFCYQLAHHMGPQQAFYAVQPHGLPGRPLPSTIEQMAAEYLALIRASFPHGPYFLGGHCNGAMVAFEMAQRLVGEGSKVELLVMMDPPVTRAHLSTEVAGTTPEASGLADPVSAAIDLDQLSAEARHNKVLQMYGRLCQSYAANFYPGKLTLLLAQEALHAQDPARGWGGKAAATEVHVVPGHHVTMITGHTDTLAKKLIECRDRIRWT
ncbi:MAG: non-ribosomal peptide synthetase, partial [Rhodoferax sp.]